MLMINSPNNPTGWVMTREQQRAVLDRCRQLGIWLVPMRSTSASYERLYYGDDAAVAPSLTWPRNERGNAVNSFSKAWLMTGWRLGWIVAPERLMEDLGKLVEYNTSCAPSFVQMAGIAAVKDGAQFTQELVAAQELVAGLRASRDYLVTALQRIPGIYVRVPAGSMYLCVLQTSGRGLQSRAVQGACARERARAGSRNAFGPE